ncbi:Conserved_hypothetical protein [Hexamita inflata]|uniref:Uncharacterized protein n=1 Tax=Hexamita inflata TaxID=28002 RepID=A0AA86QL72_9EUKA|nr:Conserved hypothetical protein [Hexamita inflata]
MPKLDFVRQNVLEFYALEHGQLHCLMCRQKFPVNGQHYECCARPRTDQLENHLLDVEFHDHEFTIAQIRAGRHQLFDVQVYSQEQREKDVLNFIVNHGFSFRTIEDPIFQKLTNVYHTRQWFADTLSQRAEEIKQTQFDIYEKSVDQWQRTPFVLFWDGWLSSIATGSRHLFCFMIKTPVNIHFVGLKWTEESNNSLWLAKTIKQLVEELEETGRLRLVAFCGDNASVNIAVQLLETMFQSLKQKKSQKELATHSMFALIIVQHDGFHCIQI